MRVNLRRHQAGHKNYAVTVPRLLTPPTPGTPDSPEEEPQRPHVTQVHPENAAQLLQRQHLLLLLPPGAMQLAAVVGGGVAVQAGGGAHRLGHGLMVAQLPGGRGFGVGGREGRHLFALGPVHNAFRTCANIPSCCSRPKCRSTHRDDLMTIDFGS